MGVSRGGGGARGRVYRLGRGDAPREASHEDAVSFTHGGRRLLCRVRGRSVFCGWGQPIILTGLLLAGFAEEVVWTRCASFFRNGYLARRRENEGVSIVGRSLNIIFFLHKMAVRRSSERGTQLVCVAIALGVIVGALAAGLDKHAASAATRASDLGWMPEKVAKSNDPMAGPYGCPLFSSP